MVEALYFVVGIIFGIILNRLWGSAHDRWAAARGMMKAPDKAKSEGKQKVSKARADAAKGRAELLRAFLTFLFIAAFVLLAAWVLWSLA